MSAAPEGEAGNPAYLWSDAYSVGHPEMDEQHRRLLALCEKAEGCSRFDDARGFETFHLVLNELFLYADSHFAAEEKLLETHGYAGLEAHQDEHEMWLERLADLLVESLDRSPDVARLQRFLRSWWVHHILESDMRYRALFAGAA